MQLILSQLGHFNGMTTLPIVVWRTYALLSELLLAVTHLKVLLCIGKPYPRDQLSDKRWTYFLYDLISPWFALASIAAPHALRAVAAAAPGAAGTAMIPSALATGLLNTSNPICFPADTAALLPANSCLGGASSNCSNKLGYYATWANSTDSVPWHGNNGLESTSNSLVGAAKGHVSAAGMHSQFGVGATLERPWIVQLLLLSVAAHAALHIYYISSWNQSHARHVVDMSSVVNHRSRLQKYKLPEVVWFVVGTGYDVVTHVVVSGLLIMALAGFF